MKRLNLFRGRLQIYLKPRGWLIGAYISRDAVHVCPMPLLVVRWTRRRRWLLDRQMDELIGGIKTEPPAPPRGFDLAGLPIVASDAVPDGQVYVINSRALAEALQFGQQVPPRSVVRLDVGGESS